MSTNGKPTACHYQIPLKDHHKDDTIFAFLSSSSFVWYGFSTALSKEIKKKGGRGGGNGGKGFANKRIPYTPSNASDDCQLHSWCLFSMGIHTH